MTRYKHFHDITPVKDITYNEHLVIAMSDATTPTGFNLYRATPKQLESVFDKAIKSAELATTLVTKAPLSGDGSPDNPITLAPEYFDKEFPASTSFDLTQVGNGHDKILPITGSYFSVNWPYGIGLYNIVGNVNHNGDLVALAPLTNGTQMRYIYCTIRNWTQGGDKVINNDIPYLIPGMPEYTYVRTVLCCSKTSMVVETADSAGPMGHAFITLNGSMDYSEHSSIDLGRKLIDAMSELEGAPMDFENLTNRHPVSFIVGGRRYIIITHYGQWYSQFKLRCLRVMDNGDLIKVGNWSVTTNAGTRSLDDPFLNEGIFGDENGNWGDFEVDPKYSTYSRATNSARKDIQMFVGQDGDKVRLQVSVCAYIRDNETGHHSTNLEYHQSYEVILSGNSNKNRLELLPEFRNSKFKFYPVSNTDTNIRVNPPIGSLDKLPWVNTNISIGRAPMDHGYIDSSSYMTVDASQLSYCKRFVGKTAYELSDGFEVYNTRSGRRNFNTLKPAFTSNRNPSVCYYLEEPITEEVLENAGNYITTRGSYINSNLLTYQHQTATPNVPSGFCNQNVWLGRYNFVSGESMGGFVLNNNRQPKDWKDPRWFYPILTAARYTGKVNTNVIRYSRAIVNPEVIEYNKVLPYEIDFNLETITTYSFNDGFASKLEAEIAKQFPIDNWVTSWSIGILPHETTNRAMVHCIAYNISESKTYRYYGLCRITKSVSGKHHTITGVQSNTLALGHNGTTTAGVGMLDKSNSNIYNIGMAIADWPDETKMIVKESVAALNASGFSVGRSGCSYFNVLDGGRTIKLIRRLRGHESTDSRSMTPTCSHRFGLGCVDASVAGATHYVYVPVETTRTDESTQLAEPFVVSAMTPATGYYLNITSDIPVVLNGVRGTIKPQSIDLSKNNSGGNSYHFLYVQVGSTDTKLVVTPFPLVETATRAFIAWAKLGPSGRTIETVHAPAFTRIGEYRVSELAQGGSIPGTSGQGSAPASTWWSTKYYP